MNQNKTWLYDVINALAKLDGEAPLQMIYREVRQLRQDLPPKWKALIRSIIYHHSSDSPQYTEGNPDVFKKVERSVWALRRCNDMISGRSDGALFNQAVLELIADKIFPCDDSDEKVKSLIGNKIAKIRRRFGM